MSLFFSAIQFIETSLLFSAFLFSTIMFVRTKDSFAGRTLVVLIPVTTLLFSSYMYSIMDTSSVSPNAEWLSPVFALLVIGLIMASILATCYYVIQLLPISKRKKRKGLLYATILVGLLLVVTAILVMYMSKSDLTRAVTNALWAFYPLCSLALFIEAIPVAGMYHKIKDSHHQKLAKYFLIAFVPQVAFSILDFILLRDICFQLTHVSYAVFSVFVFVDLCAYFFKKYNTTLDISNKERAIQEKYSLSDRELEVIELLAEGFTNQKIGEQLHISVNTVKSHIKRIYQKLRISNRLQLINKLTSNGNSQNTI